MQDRFDFVCGMRAAVRRFREWSGTPISRANPHIGIYRQMLCIGHEASLPRICVNASRIVIELGGGLRASLYRRDPGHLPVVFNQPGESRMANRAYFNQAVSCKLSGCR